MTPVNDGILIDIAQAVTVSPVSTDIVYAVLPVAPNFLPYIVSDQKVRPVPCMFRLC